MALILSPGEISFIFPLLEENLFSWVVSKELCPKAGHVGAVVWTGSGLILSRRGCLIYLPTEVYVGECSEDALNYVCLKATF